MLKCIAAFWVVMIHVAAVPATHIANVPLNWWWWANLYNAGSRAAVPLFIMVSGALLLNRTDWHTPTFLRRRALKIAPPMIFWSLFYDAWRSARNGTASAMHDWLAHLTNGMNAPAYPHLWFLWLIAGLYLLAPLLQPFVANATRQTHVYVAALWFSVTVAVPCVDRWLHVPFGIYTDPIAGYVGYFLVGASICRFAPERLPPRLTKTLVCIFVACAALNIVGTAMLSEGKTQLDEFFMYPLSPSVIPMSVSAFLLIRHWAPVAAASPRHRSVMATIGASSFGIYLLHPLILDLEAMAGLSLDPLIANPGWYAPLLAGLTFALSAACAMAMRRSSLLCRVVP